jgi:alpha-amylase
MNPTMIQFFHWYESGKLVKEAEKQARYLAKLGITSVWFPPAYKGTNGGYSTGYDAYDLMTWRI